MKSIERIETYDKGVLIMIYLNKEHDTNEKYIIYDNILTPLVAFLNNVLSYQEKRKIMKRLILKKKFIITLQKIN